MTDMKCPFCGQKLNKIPSYQIDGDWFCPNCCMSGTKKLWQELIRTRKALDVAVDAIDKILFLDSGKFCKEPAEMWKIAKSAKDQIKTITEKE